MRGKLTQDNTVLATHLGKDYVFQISPGLTAFTLTPRGPSCSAVHFVSMSMAALDMQYGVMMGSGLFDRILEIFTTFPFVLTTSTTLQRDRRHQHGCSVQ